MDSLGIRLALSLFAASAILAAGGAYQDPAEKDAWWRQRAPKLGDAAPPLSLEAWVGEAKGLPDAAALDWTKLAGKVVVMDFSCSWCGPCARSLPHLDGLAQALADDPRFVFLVVSNESVADIEAWRGRQPVKMPIARDADGSTFEAFWVNGIPSAYVIDAKGMIAAMTHPEGITAEALRRLADGGGMGIAPDGRERTRRNWDARPAAERGDALVTAGVRLVRAAKAGGMVRMDPKTGRIEARGLGREILVATAFDVRSRDITWDSPADPELIFDLEVLPPDGTLAMARTMAQEALQETLGLKAVFEDQKRTVVALRRKEGAPPPPPPSSESRGSRIQPGNIDLKRAPVASLVRALNTWSDKPIIDETGLEGEFTLTLSWDPTGGADALKSALGELGFVLEKLEKDVPILVVSRR